MSRFSKEWLDLREEADFNARNKALAERAIRWVRSAKTTAPVIVDLGTGTGSTLRALTTLGANGCIWRLVDYDPVLLNAALRRHVHETVIEDYEADIVQLDELPLNGAHLVTASALFDLVSADLVDGLIKRLQSQRCAFYAAINYDGNTEWSPHHPYDAAVLKTFNQDQQREKGLGAALGPGSPAYLINAFTAAGYTVHTGDSPWCLDGKNRILVKELINGIYQAVAWGYGLDKLLLEDWKRFRLSHIKNGICVIGHQDILALPPGIDESELR